MSSSAEAAAPMRRGRSIAWPIFALAIGAVAAAHAIMFAVMYAGPPPNERPHAIAEVAAALVGKPWNEDTWLRSDGARPRAERGGPPPGERRARREVFGPPPFARTAATPLRIATAAQPPAPGWRETSDPDAAARIAAEAQLPPATVIAYTEAGGRPFRRELFGRFTVAVRHGSTWRVVRSPRMPLLTSWHVRTLAAMLLAIAALAVPAWLISRAITRPLRDLADAAAQARAGATRPDFPRGGAGEVRALTRAVAAMHDRLSAHAQTRTALLGAIAHDLGTPLSRLAFWVEHLPEASRDRAAADIAEMRGMIAGTLRFAREEGAALETARVDLASLLDSLVEDMATTRENGAVTLAPCPRAIVRGDPGGLRRAFANLVENALRYAGTAEVACRVEGASVAVTVADEGPGLGNAIPERLFEPFVRGDPSRNRATGGSGLGLAIVRGIAERHGGEATLANRPGGGAIATVTLPLER